MYSCLQIKKLPYNRNFIAMVNDSLGQNMPFHIWRGFTLLPSPSEPISHVEVSTKAVFHLEVRLPRSVLKNRPI